MRFRKERGQATIGALLLLPIILAIATAFALLAVAIAFESHATTACRVRVAKQQAEAARAVEELLKLNPSAKRLQTLRVGAERGLALAIATGNPGAIALAAGALRSVKAAQVPVRALQIRWLAYGRKASAQTPAEARAAIQDSLPPILGNQLHPGGVQLVRPKFRMVADSPRDQTPVYLPAPDFQVSQNGGIKWKAKLKQTALDSIIPSIEMGCTMTLEPITKDKWVPSPTEDKLSSN